MVSRAMNRSLMIHVEVAYAKANQQKIIAVEVKQGTSVIDAVRESSIIDYFPELELNELKLGIFGKIVLDPVTRVLKPGERVEIYRPLTADPKKNRKRRAKNQGIQKVNKSKNS